MKSARILILTSLAMVAFASNSLLCRAALKQTAIDAATFTSIRIISGAMVLWIIVKLRNDFAKMAGTWASAFALYTYAAAFSFAYNTLAAGTGALLLFGAVQATMIAWSLRRGERLDGIQCLGLSLAVIGLIALVFPGLSAPPVAGSILMVCGGMAWGIYSLRGQGETRPVSATAGNFIRAVPFAVVVSLIFLPATRLDRLGALYAIVSGAITSGIGYVIWYAALPELKGASAATVQLSVPVLAATGGILLLGESVTVRYLLASSAVLGGIALVVLERRVRGED